MPRIFTLGESILDIIFRDDEVKASRPGGSMLNAAVSLGRLGMEVYMVSDLSYDNAGKIILQFLLKNNVRIDHIQQYKDGKTPVSLAMLDADNNARYTFYRELPGNRLNGNFPGLQQGDVLLFGSFYSLDPEIYPRIREFVFKSKQKGAFIIYDPNIRKNHLGDIGRWLPHLEENLGLADFVRASDEDFHNVFGLEDAREIFRKVNSYGVSSMVLTRGGQGADYYSEGLHVHHDAKEIQVISTIGAGDSFNAGLIYALLKSGKVPGKDFKPDNELVKKLLYYGTEFAASVCLSYDNYISSDLPAKLDG